MCKLGQLYDTGGINRGSIGTASIASRWRKPRIMSTSLKVILETQPMMNRLMDCALFEGDTTTTKVRQYHFLSIFLCFMIFLVFFILISLKRIKLLIVQQGGNECRGKAN